MTMNPVQGGGGGSSDNSATFYPGDHEELIKRLAVSKRLVARTQPYNESPVTAVFDLTSIREAVTPVREACGF